MAVPAAAVAVGSYYLHRTDILTVARQTPWMAAVWTFTLSMAVLQLILSWSQRVYRVTPEQQRELDGLQVTVVIPCYNEDQAILDRVLYSISRQTRLPQRVIVVDDGSRVSYDDVRDWWAVHLPCPLTWIRQDNAGKKHAQAAAFTADLDAEVFVTIDSDSALTSNALEEGLKPLANPEVVSVAGLETAYNFRRNILTRAVAARSLSFQLFAMSAQSVAGGTVLINPGAFSLYRAWLIRKILPAYIGETFLGIPVTLGDDTALTTFALCHGKAVHQPSAVALNVYPETLSHHLRQWTRWMRASTIRTLWRIRYLPPMSWGWLYVVYSTWAFLNSVAITAVIPFTWPASWRLGVAVLVASVAWPVLLAVRYAGTVERSDQTILDVVAALLLLPLASIWFLLVLRQIRFYGMATCHRQGWVTRAQVEVHAITQA
jgi:hyaluronan synthase